MSGEEEGVVLKTSWKRKEDRVNFFAQGAATSDFFDLLKAGAEQLVNKTVHSGYLTKSGGKGIKQNWRKRWFVLTYDKYLYYYKTPQDTEPTGVICLTDYEAITPEDGKKFRFMLHNNEKSSVRVFRLMAASQQEMLQWMASIEQVLRSPVLENAKTKIIRKDADDCILPGGVRRDCRLYIRVVEGKDLPKISSLNTYCLAGLDTVNQQRTQTVWKSRAPLWSETFHLDVRKRDGSLRLMCWRTGEGFRDSILGMFEVPLDSLQDQRQHDQWFPLLAPATQRFISGEMHLKVEYKPAERGKAGSLMVQVVGARNLAPKGTGGLANPFMKLQFGKKRRKTKTVTNTLEPSFNEVFEFKLADSHPKELLVTVWHQDMLKNMFMGKVLLALSSFDPNFLYDAWYPCVDHEEGDATEEDEDYAESREEEVDAASESTPAAGRAHFAESVPVADDRRKMRTNTLLENRKPRSLRPNESAPSAAVRQAMSPLHLQERSASCVTPPPKRVVASRGTGGWLKARVAREDDDEPDPVALALRDDVALEIKQTGLMRAQSTDDLAPVKRRPELERANSSSAIVARQVSPLSIATDSDDEGGDVERSTSPTATATASPSASPSGAAATTSPSSQLAALGESSEEVLRAGKNLGSIRLVLKYTEEIVLPITKYEPLLELLLDEEQVIVDILGQVTTEREQVATALCRVAEHRGKAIMLVSTATCREVDNTPDPDVIFRANTLATKALDYYMKLVGLPYLKQTLGAVVKEAYTFRKGFEVDPHRIDKGEDVSKNFANLRAIIESATAAILESTDDCPHKLRHVFHSLQQKVKERYPPESIEVTKYTAVSGFLFLRFFCAAILGPKLFDLEKEHPEEKTARILTLISKTIQNLSNLAEFGYKEPYMADMNEFITSNIDNMKTFIDSISTLPATPRKEETPDIDFGRELATIHRHLINNRAEMLALKPDCVELEKLGKVLDDLEEAKSEYVTEGEGGDKDRGAAF